MFRLVVLPCFNCVGLTVSMYILYVRTCTYTMYVFSVLPALFQHTFELIACTLVYLANSYVCTYSLVHINYSSIINPRRACARVTVLVPSVCLSVCVFSLFWHLAQSGVQTAVSATSARYGHEI